MGLFCRYCIWWSLWQVTAWVCLHPEIDRTSSTLERRLWSVLQNTLCSSNQNVWCSLMLSEGIWKYFIRKLHVTWEPKFDFVQSGQLEISFLEILLEDWKKICFVSQIVLWLWSIMVCREISPVQRLRALVCMCMRMAPPLRLPKPSQRGPLHINKYKMDTICRNSASALVASTSFSLHPCHGQGGRQSRNEKNGHHSSTGALYLGPKSKRTVGKNFLSVEGSPKVLMQRRVSSSCFPRAVLTEGFATTQEAWQLLLPALLKFPK